MITGQPYRRAARGLLVTALCIGACEQKPSDTRRDESRIVRADSGVTTSYQLSVVHGARGVPDTVNIGPLRRDAAARELVPSVRMANGALEGSAPFSEIIGVQLTHSSVFVGDAGTSMLTQYSLDGRVLRRIGRNGSGPGEFRKLLWLFPYRRNSIVAVDYRTRRLTLFDETGKAAGFTSLRVPDSSVGEWFVPIAATTNGVMYYGARHINAGAPKPRELRYLVTLYRGTFESVASQPIRRTRDALNHEGPFLDLGEIPFGGVAHFAAAGNALYISDPEKPEIVECDSAGALRRVFRLDMPRLAIQRRDEDLERARLRELQRRELDGVPERFVRGLRQFVDEVPFPDSFPTLNGVMADADGRLIVELFEPPTEHMSAPAYLYVDLERARVHLFRLQPGVHARSFLDGRIAAVRTDSEGVESVEMYDLPTEWMTPRPRHR